LASRETTTSRVRAVVVHFGPESLVRACVESLAAFAPGAEVVVVDHGPAPLPGDAFGGAGQAVRIVRPPGNAGYGSGCNAGAAGSGRELLLFLNNDVCLTAGALEALVRSLDARTDTAIAGPRLVDGAGCGARAVHRLPSPWRLLMENVPVGRLLPFVAAFEGNNTVRQPRNESEVEAVLGAAFLVRRRDFEEAGGFDGEYFHFAEEDDLFRRIRARGRGVVFVPDAVFVHQGSAASESIPIETLDEWKANGFLRYAAKHHGPGGRRRAWCALLLGARLRQLAASLPGALGSRERVRRFAALVKYLRNVER
jgi:GT2 family glycosyltransferase